MRRRIEREEEDKDKKKRGRLTVINQSMRSLGDGELGRGLVQTRLRFGGCGGNGHGRGGNGHGCYGDGRGGGDGRGLDGGRGVVYRERVGTRRRRLQERAVRSGSLTIGGGKGTQGPTRREAQTTHLVLLHLGRERGGRGRQHEQQRAHEKRYLHRAVLHHLSWEDRFHLPQCGAGRRV